MTDSWLEGKSVRSILQHYRLKAKKSLGQNFLVDETVLDAMLLALDLDSVDRLVEVGPGLGVLTCCLGETGKEVISLEIDKDLIPLLQQLTEQYPNVRVLEHDALHWTPTSGRYSVVANIPFYITSPLLRHFLRECEFRPRQILMLVQKEVAERICDLRKPTLISWEVRVFGDPTLLLVVPPTAFYPMPKVQSALLRIDLYERPLVELEDLTSFFRFLSLAFSHPRKTLLNNLKVFDKLWVDTLKATLIELGLSEQVRPHEMSLHEWKVLFSLS